MAVIATVSLTIAACADKPPLVPRAELAVVDGDSLPAPTREDVTLKGRAYALGPGDRISIEVFGLPELTREVTLDAGGQVTLPLAGVIPAAGKTTVEVGELVQVALRANHVRDPQVTVNLTEGISQVVTVEGEVRDPGNYPVRGETTLLRTIANANGLTEFAKAEHVVVLRRVGGQDMAALYDLRAIRQGYYRDPDIYAQDIVLVGESRSRRLFQNVIQGSGLITTPIIALVQSL